MEATQERNGMSVANVGKHTVERDSMHLIRMGEAFLKMKKVFFRNLPF